MTIPTFLEMVDRTTEARDMTSSGLSLSESIRLMYRSSDLLSRPESARWST